MPINLARETIITEEEATQISGNPDLELLTRFFFLFLSALQKIRQASLLEELREACQAKYKEKKSDANKEEGGNNAKLLTCIAESQDPPELPPSFILNLVKSESFFSRS